MVVRRLDGLALTDGVDGWIARRYGSTRSGAFLDPLADKVLVLGAMTMLVAEAACGGSRSRHQSARAGREPAPQLLGTPRARGAGHQPGQGQDVGPAMAVGWALFPPTAVGVPIIADVFLWLAVALTLVTGYQYFSRAGITHDRHGIEPERPPPCAVRSSRSGPSSCSAGRRHQLVVDR